MKRLLATLAAGLVITMPSTGARAIPSPPVFLLIFPNGTSAGCYLYPNGHQESLGYFFGISNSDSVKRTIKQTEGFWSATLAPGKEKEEMVRAAGTYLQTCDAGPARAPIAVKPSAPGHPASPSFTVTWATSSAGNKWKYGVQYRLGTGAFVGWKTNTSLRSATFNGLPGKVYYFRARVRNPKSGKSTAWSPLIKVVT